MRCSRGLALAVAVTILLGAAASPAATMALAAAAANPPAAAPPPPDLTPRAASAVLMDAASGLVLWEKNAHEKRPVASITKLMTMALVMDALQDGRVSWDDRVTASENAWHTGGAQIWLEVGEQMSLKDLFTAVAVVSANDAAVALAEHVGGGIPQFVADMNRKAAELGMRDTTYTNPHGLDEEGHVSSAYDVALVSRYLVTRYPEVLGFTAIYDTYLRQNIPGKKPLWLVNTNRKLLHAYPGLDGLKTGWTDEAGYGIAVTAKRGDSRLIAVVLGYADPKARNAEAAQLLNYGFGRYATVVLARRGTAVAQLPVDLGRQRSVPVAPQSDAAVTVEKGQEKTVSRSLELPARLEAPVKAGQTVGELVVAQRGKVLARFPLVAQAEVGRVGLFGLMGRLLLDTWPWRR